MNDSREGFASFIAGASRGRKIGAILSWVAAAILLAALFTPMFKVGILTKEDVAAVEEAENKSIEEISYTALEFYMRNKERHLTRQGAL